MLKLYRKLDEAFSRLRPQVLRPAEGYLKYDYLVPGGYYQELWDWDGFFIGLHLLSRGGKDAAQPLKCWALNFLAAARDDGYAPGCLTPRGPETGHRAFQMKPFLAQGVWLAAHAANDFGWVRQHYARLRQVATCREATHLDPRYGLFAWDHAMQSGADNNPALSNDPGAPRAILACDLNAFQFGEYAALGRIAAELKHTRDVHEFRGKAEALKAAINRHHWCGADGSYWNIRRDSGEFVRRVSCSNFAPLVYRMASQANAERMVRRYLWSEEHLLGSCGFRSLSRQDTEYNNANIIAPYSNWQGPVWPIANYLYFRALMNYGFEVEAEAIAETVAELCLDDIDACGSMHENYHADTGAPLAPSPRSSPSGRVEGGFVGWNLLVQNMLEELHSGEDPLGVDA